MSDPSPVPTSRQLVAAVVERARLAAPRCGSTVVVAIDGPSGAGKTTLARGVAAGLRLGEGDLPGADQTVEVVHMDHLYPGWDGLALAPGLLTTQVLEPIARGHPAAYRRWSWVRDRWNGRREVCPSRLLVVEGCGSSVMPAGAYAAVRVFVDADSELRMVRGLARDGEAYRPHWQRWADQENELFERDGTRRRADLLIDTSTL